MSKFILGIHNSGINSSAALVKDGEVIAGCQEERLIRQKYHKGFPVKAIEFCLGKAGMGVNDLEAVAVGWNPGIHLASRYRPGFSDWPAYAGQRLYTTPNRILPRTGNHELEITEQYFRGNGFSTSIHHVTHHLAHLALAFYLSPFAKAALFSCDGYGERQTAVWATGDKKGIHVLQDVDFPHSIGQLYSAITEFLGFRPDLDEWKVMGAAACGRPDRYYKKLKNLISLLPEGKFELDLSYFNHYNFETPFFYNDKMIRLLGRPRVHGEPILQRHFDLAAAIQLLAEECLTHCLLHLHKLTGLTALCVSGGTFMNCVYNGMIHRATPFKKLFVPYAADDAGNAAGAALYTHFHLQGGGRPSKINPSSAIGPEYSDSRIIEFLDRCRLTYRVCENIESETSGLAAGGKVIGWFQGALEFGARALGNRSIVADPRRMDMKDIINGKIKNRESFRPFAFSILKEKTREWLDVPAGWEAPYMERAVPVLAEKRELIPSVVHNDGTARIQTVTAIDHPRYIKLIKEFRNLSGVPLILNTSFNLDGEPIVASVDDALRTYFTSGLDALAIGNALLVK